MGEIVTASQMTRQEREALAKLVRQRERVAKTAAIERSAQMMADFEAQMDRQYDFDEDQVWNAAALAAKTLVAEAQEKVAQRCRELGIPPEFAPGLSVTWHGRGRNAVSFECAEMRRLAKRRIEQMEATARTQIERASLGAQERLLIGGLTTDAARTEIEALPSIDALMPQLDLAEVQAKLSQQKDLRASRLLGYEE